MPINLTDDQLYEEYNKLSSLELCILAQETVQDSVTKVADFVTLLRVTSSATLINDQNAYVQRKLRLEETLNTFDVIFQRLRVVGTIVHDRQQLQQQQQRLGEHQTDSTALEQLKREQTELKDELKLKNSYLKLAIDKVSEIIWQINSMQKK